MGRIVVMVHGFMRSVSVPGHLCELTSTFTIQQPYNNLRNAVVNISKKKSRRTQI